MAKKSKYEVCLPDKTYPYDRKQIRSCIIDREVASKKKPRGKPVAILTMGVPGTGKTTIVGPMIRGKGFVCSCPDDIKDHLPEFPFAISKGSKTAGTIVQRESVILAARIADLAVKERKNLLIDGTGALLNRYKNVIRRLKRAGYRVEVVGVHAPMSIVKERIAKRAKATGRYVPAKVLEWYAGKVPCNFVPVSKVADSFALYDVSGKKPRAILVKKNNRRTADPVELARITKKCRL